MSSEPWASPNAHQRERRICALCLARKAAEKARQYIALVGMSRSTAPFQTITAKAPQTLGTLYLAQRFAIQQGGFSNGRRSGNPSNAALRNTGINFIWCGLIFVLAFLLGYGIAWLLIKLPAKVLFRKHLTEPVDAWLIAEKKRDVKRA